MTIEEFTPLYLSLVYQLRAGDADEASLRSYYAALADLEWEFVAMAADQFARTAEWFPKTSEWRIGAAAAETARIAELRAIMRRLPTPLCLFCDDTGWAPVPGSNRVKRCDCATLRRLEVLGRRPMPMLPEHAESR